MSKRQFGYIRQLPSGRFQASYLGPDGTRYNAPHTYSTRLQAREFLRTQDALIRLDQWERKSESTDDPAAYDTDMPLFGVYCERHISIQTTYTGDLLEASTQHLYRNLLRTHLSPFSPLRLDEISESAVSDWWAEAIKSGKKTTLSKAYKLLSSVMKRAVDEKKIRENPCRVKGAHSATTGKKIEFPSNTEIAKLAQHINPRYRVMVIVAANAGLRFGEVTALRRCDIVPAIRDGQKAFNVIVCRAVGWAGGKPYAKAPKSSAGNRVIPLSPDLTSVIEVHLKDLPDENDEALIFPSKSGGVLAARRVYEFFSTRAHSFRAIQKIHPSWPPTLLRHGAG